MAALFRAEMTKQWRRPRTYVALGITVAIPVITTIAIKTNPPSSPSGGGGLGNFAIISQATGLYLPVLALRFMSRFLLVILVALFAGDAVASEANWGNLRSMLTRPVSRSRLLLVKVESAGLMAVIATALIGVTGLVAGTIAFGWHPLNAQTVSGLHLFHIQANAFQSTSQLLGNLALASGYVLWSIAGVAALAFMVSTMTDSPAAAVFAGVGLYIVSQILNNISSLDPISFIFPTHYMDAWTSLFEGSGPTGDMLRGTLLQIPYVVVFGTYAWWSFRRKDVLS